MRIFLFLLLLISPLFSFGQWKYKTKYKHAIYSEMLGLSKGISLNYNNILYQESKGFVSSSIGVAFVSGLRGDIFTQSGVGIPITLTYNYSLGDLDKRIKKRVTRKCITKPSALDFEWFGEGGVGFCPVFYKMLPDERKYAGYLGLRVHLQVSRPYKNSDLVLFLRGGYSPFYRSSRGFRYLPHETGALGGSLGVSI